MLLLIYSGCSNLSNAGHPLFTHPVFITIFSNAHALFKHHVVIANNINASSYLLQPFQENIKLYFGILPCWFANKMSLSADTSKKV